MLFYLINGVTPILTVKRSMKIKVNTFIRSSFVNTKTFRGMIWFQLIVSGRVSLCAELAWTHRDVAVNDQQLLSGYVELAAEFIGFPV